MGNNSSREQRRQSRSPTSRPTTSAGGPASPTDQLNAPVYSSRVGRGSRHDLSFLGIGAGSNVEITETRRESKQEREARKLEKERVARLKERERSMKEEHVDGGYLVTQGVYTGTEDFNKSIVRQLMIERRIAPFWRGLEDHKDNWTEHQLVAAARGLPIPAADEIPPEDPARSASSELQPRSSSHLQNLMVPITARSHSNASDISSTLSPAHPAFSAMSTSPPVNSSSSPFRPRSKTFASLTTSSRNPSQSDLVPREVQLPQDPYINGSAIEAFLYKDAAECPICFLYYPPYLNKTRCCDQPICSECFVQIKRPDPHPPEHGDPSDPAHTAETTDPETLVSEPSTCPYCQQAEFGVTYEPPPFRRGLSYANMANLASAMSSSSSINSDGSPSIVPATQRRRTTSISANNSSVITTDRIRPDWATKLINARNHVARRSAAATALHTAAYLMGNNGGSEGRGFGFSSRSRFGRSRGEAQGNGGADSPPEGRNNTLGAFAALAERHAVLNRGNTATPSASSRRRSRLDDLEDMMMNEAIRLSLAAEEERSKKEEKERKKTEKKKEKEREKEAKKAEKAARKSMYGGGSSASGSTLSLSLPGRRRGNSTNSSLFKDSADKGKGVDRGNSFGIGSSSSAQTASTPAPIDFGRQGKHNDSSPTALQFGDGTIHTPTIPTQSSHLRYMSNASSPASSYVESANGSLSGHQHGSNSSFGDSPDASGTNVNGHDELAANAEPMFNFRRLAETIGEEDAEDKAEASRHVEYLGGESSHEFQAELQRRDTEAAKDGNMDESVATVKPGDHENWTTPALTITPVTPAAEIDDDNGKQLQQGIFETVETRELV